MTMTFVDVHCLDLNAAIPELGYWREMLDDDECVQAERFRFDLDRHHYIVRRGWLRQLLSGRLEISPQDIRFSFNEFGKPFLREGKFSFSLSRSSGKALCVIAPGLELGCDLERRNPELASNAIAQRFFSRVEQNALSLLPVDRWLEGFFNCWTRKEAYMKARGFGLSFPLETFDVSLAPGEPACLIRGCEGWSIQSLEPAPGFAAAVVGEGIQWTLR